MRLLMLLYWCWCPAIDATYGMCVTFVRVAPAYPPLTIGRRFSNTYAYPTIIPKGTGN